MKQTKRTVFIAVFTAFIYVLGLIPLIEVPILAGVPMVLQNMGIFLAASVLGIMGVLSVILLLLLALLGLPVLAGGRGGFVVFLGPTGGYLFGYLLAAVCIGLLTTNFWDRYSLVFAIVFNLLGMLCIYLVGIPFFSVVTGTKLGDVILGNLIFMPGDVIKVVLASLIAVQFKKYYPLVVSRQDWSI